MAKVHPIEDPANEAKARAAQQQKAELDAIEIDLSGLRLKDYRAFFAASQANDFEAMYGVMSRVIKGWAYEGDPSVPASYDELTIDQWMVCGRALGAALQSKFARGN